jgi:hypothetical protein
VIAQDDVPFRQQGRIGVDLLERALPLRIGNACRAVLVEIVAHRNDRATADRGGAAPHLPRHLVLLPAAIAPPVADRHEIQ